MAAAYAAGRRKDGALGAALSLVLGPATRTDNAVSKKADLAVQRLLDKKAYALLRTTTFTSNRHV